jgi:hypothetical protein
MGFLDTLLGRSKPKPANLDALFAIPDAALTLQTAADFQPSGVGSVCFKAAEGAAATMATTEGQALLGRAEQVRDSYGFTWLVVRHDPGDVSGLVTDLHAANSTLQDAGFGPLLLCSLVAFADEARRRLGLVYLYKRGTFYPFAPLGDEKRDTALELQVRGLLGNDLKIEPELARWFPVWGAPGL